MSRDFVARKDRRKHVFSLAYGDDLAKTLEEHTAMSKEKSNEPMKQEDPGVLKRIVLDAFPHVDPIQGTIQINILSINKEQIEYVIMRDQTETVRTVSLSKFEIKQAIDGIVKHNIRSLSQTMKKSGVKSILEHFSVIRVEPPGIFAHIKSTVANFFGQLLPRFRFIESIWEAISHDSEKKEARLRWDLDLMAATCGVAPDRVISITESLRYMAAMMKRESPGDTATNPALVKRIRDGAKLGMKMDKLRASFKTSRFENLSEEIARSIVNLSAGEKILIPISYVKKGKSIQMLMEVGKDEDDTNFTVTLISQSEDTRALFDREHHLSESQSPRREISNVKKNDLLAMLPIILQLDTAPQCRSHTLQTNWESVFMQALKMPGTVVQAGLISNKYASGSSPSHVEETLSYIARQQDTTDKTKRFELAARLRIFLDLTASSGEALRNPRYWRLVRTCTNQLARMIEENKEVIGTGEEQSSEMMRIYSQLNERIERLDKNLPELPDMSVQTTANLSGLAKLSPEPETQPLVRGRVRPNTYPKVQYPFEALDADNPCSSIITWGHRCQALVDANAVDLASREAKLMVRMLPDPATFLNAVTPDKAPKILQALNAITEALVRGSLGPDQPTLHTIASAVALSHYAGALLKKEETYKKLTIVGTAVESVKGLAKTRLSEADQQWLKGIRDGLPMNTIGHDLEDYLTSSGAIQEQHQRILQPVHNICQLTRILIGDLTVDSLPTHQIKFGWNRRTHLPNGGGVRIGKAPVSNIPLEFRSPEYAKDVAHEIANRYTTEHCCLGCIRDNCPKYNMVSKEDMRFHPLYMLHNYVNIFCEKLAGRGDLRRDELTDLLYTQQTNQNAKNIFKDQHQQQHATTAATGFNAEDHRIQAMNTIAIYLDHPHFFKHPDLCWQFETRLFTQGAFKELLKDSSSLGEHKPFLLSILRRLKKEIRISYAAGEIEVAGYLLHVSDRLRDLIEELPEELKATREELASLVESNSSALLQKWGKDLVGKMDEQAQQQMRMILPLLMNSYHSRLMKNSSDPCFKDPEQLKTLLLCAGRIEGMRKDKKKIDPEIYDRYRALMAWVLPRVKECFDKEPGTGEFINSLLLILHPQTAALKLQWDSSDMPIVSAVDLEGKLYKYDLTTGQLQTQIIDKEHPLERLSVEIPDNLRRDPDLQRLFGDYLNHSWKIRDSESDSSPLQVREYTHENFPQYRILSKKQGSQKTRLVIERKITRLSGKKAGKEEWMSYKRFREQDLVAKGDKCSSPPDLPSQIAQQIGDRHCWIDRAGTEVYVLDPAIDKPYAVLKMKRVMRKKKQVVRGVRIITDAHLIHENTHLLSPDPLINERFSMLEDPKHIIVSGRKSKPDTVRFSRYQLASSEASLTYTLGQKKITTAAFPGYVLAPYGTRAGSRDPSFGVSPLPPAFDAYHLLQKEGDERILIPFCQFEQDINVSGDGLRSSHAVFSEGYTKVPIYEYKVDPNTNRLSAESGDAYAHLAYLSLIHWDYASAAHYLEKAKTSAGYGDNYDTIFQWIENWTDNSPNGVALRIRFLLLRENVLDERSAQAIATGKPQKAEDVALHQTQRLVALADLYAKYQKHTDARRPSNEGRSRALDLSSEQKLNVSGYVRKLIASHGKELVQTGEPIPVRAEMAPLQEYTRDDLEPHGLKIKSGALAIWLFGGAEKHKSTLAIQDPRWVLRDFRDVFNQLLNDRPESVKFKLLVNELRMLSECMSDQIDPVEQKQLKTAQAYLLKLASARVEEDFILSIKDNILHKSGRKLPEINGPLFLSRRSNSLKILLAVTSCIGPQSDPSSRKGAENLLERLGKYEGLHRGSLLYLRANLTVYLRGNKTYSAENCRSFILESILGCAGARSVEKLNEVLLRLDAYKPGLNKDLSQPIQELEARPASKQNLQTYRTKYGPLLLKHHDQVKLSDLAILEQEIGSLPAEVDLIGEITTPDEDKQTILHQNLKAYEEKFTKTHRDPVPVSQTIFDRLDNSEEKAFRRISKEHRADLNAFQSERNGYKLSRGDVITLHEGLERELEASKTELGEFRRSILQYVERFETPAGTLELRRLVGAAVKPSLDLLLALWRKNEIKLAWDSNPLKSLGLIHMTPEALDALDQEITSYLKLDAKVNHLERSIDASASYRDSCSAPPDSNGDAQLAQELWENLHTQRHFALTDPDARDMLYLEYSLGIVLRPQQVVTIRDMLSDPNAVRQLIMGGGKSKVLLPMLSKRKANGKNLVMLMLPDELYETNCRDLDATNRLLFRQEMHRFNFSRNSDRSTGALLSTYKMLLKTIRDQGFVMTTKSSMLSFKNAYVEVLYKLKDSPPDSDERRRLAREVQAMSKILKLFQERCDVIADEVDACLDVRKEVNFSLGDAEPVDKVKIDLGRELMTLILEAKENEPLYELREAVVKNTQGVIAPNRRLELLRQLAEAYYAKHFGGAEQFNCDSFCNYIMDANGDTNVRDQVLGLKESEPELYHQITTLKAFINRGFGTSFGRIGSVNYGRDPVSGIWTIPYKASNTPNIGSEFDDDIERIAFTYQDYLQNGINYKQVEHYISRVLKRARDELRARESEEFLSLNDTQGAKDFKAFLEAIDPDQGLGALSLSLAASPERIKSIVSIINSTPEGCLAFCHTQVAGQMTQFSAQINSSSQDLVGMVRNFAGFTGTPWNLHTYHDKINAQKSQGVDGQTWALMLGRDVPVHQFDFDAGNPIDSLLDGLNVLGEYQAVVDTGAYLRGRDNSEFIDACMKKSETDGPRLGGGIYFDKTGRIVKIGRVGEKPQAIETAPETDKMTNITLYDQGHTVGADIKQGKTAKAIVTVGENTFVRDLFQAVWRMRQLHQGQRVELAISNDIRDRILAGKPQGSSVKSEDILRFCLQNEASREAEDNFRAEKEKIQGTAKRLGFAEMVNIAASDDRDDEVLVEMAGKIVTSELGLFIKERPREEAYEGYGQLKMKKEPAVVFEDLRTSAALKCEELAEHLQEISPDASARCKDMGSQVLNRKRPPPNQSPNLVDSSVATGGGEVELEAQAEVENTLELMLETEIELAVSVEKIIPMVNSGIAGHGEVSPLKKIQVLNVASTPEQKPPQELRRITSVVKFFDPSIFSSAVFERNIPIDDLSEAPPQTVFYSNRKPVTFVIIAKNKLNQWVMIIPTIHEAHAAGREWINDTSLNAVEVKISAGSPIVMYKSGEDRSDQLPFDDKDMPSFYRLYVQAKLFNGEISFETSDEKEALKKWLKEVGAQEFAKYFEANILGAKAQRFVDSYAKSSLKKIIDEVIDEEA